MKIEYEHFNSLWRRIGLFFDDHWFLEWLITIASIFGLIILFAFFGVSLGKDVTTNISKNGKLYKHIIAIERTYGVTDTLIYYDINTGVEADLVNVSNILVLKTNGVNWLGLEINNETKFENTKNFKIIK